MPGIGNGSCTQPAGMFCLVFGNSSRLTIFEALNAATDETQQVVQGNSAALIAWLFLNIWPSHLGLPLLILTILFAKNIRRHATFINLCVTWIIVGLSSSLLYAAAVLYLIDPA